MRKIVLQMAEEVILRSSRENPADAALRKLFAGDRNLPAEMRAEIAAAVFRWFRWFGWLNKQESVERGLLRAAELDAVFQADPDRMPDTELVPRAIPGWTRGHLERDAGWVRSLQHLPRLWLRAKPGQAAALAEALGDCHPGPEGFPDTLEYTGPNDLFHTKEFKSGAFEIQDVASQAVGIICAPQKGETWWDACAGEGGKTLHLSALMGNSGLIWASDRSEWRMRVLKKRAARAGVFNYRGRAWDGSSKLPTKTLFDGVLVDAPCSGLGTWGRNPHARWTTTVDDVNELAAVQTGLLINAAALVKPGGRLLYSVCTIARRETSECAQRIDELLPHFERLPIGLPGRPAARDLNLWPQELGGNAMYIAAWRRAR